MTPLMREVIRETRAGLEGRVDLMSTAVEERTVEIEVRPAARIVSPDSVHCRVSRRFLTKPKANLLEKRRGKKRDSYRLNPQSHLRPPTHTQLPRSHPHT